MVSTNKYCHKVCTSGGLSFGGEIDECTILLHTNELSSLPGTVISATKGEIGVIFDFKFWKCIYSLSRMG